MTIDGDCRTARESLDRDGYFLLPNVFTRAEMAELGRSIEAYHRNTMAWVRDNVDTAGISRPDEITFTCHIAGKGSCGARVLPSARAGGAQHRDHRRQRRSLLEPVGLQRARGQARVPLAPGRRLHAGLTFSLLDDLAQR